LAPAGPIVTILELQDAETEKQVMDAALQRIEGILPMRTLRLTLLAMAILGAPHAHAEVWSPWNDLANFKPDADPLKQARAGRGHSDKDYEIQRIEDGEGDAINVDEYVVRIDALPTGKNKARFFWDVRKNLNDFFDHSVSTFGGYNAADDGDWSSQSEALLGTIMVFVIKTPGMTHDDGAVVVSKTSDFSWVFSPIDDGLFGSFGTHPVAGNREFGLREVGGRMEFYTRAFDRVYPIQVSLDEEGAFKGADKLWKSLQSNLEAYVNANGGSATKISPNVPGGTAPSNKPQYAAVCADPAIKLSCN
jgi:hypothetical protein